MNGLRHTIRHRFTGFRITPLLGGVFAFWAHSTLLGTRHVGLPSAALSLRSNDILRGHFTPTPYCTGVVNEEIPPSCAQVTTRAAMTVPDPRLTVNRKSHTIANMKTTELRTAAIATRIRPSLKQALEELAEADRRKFANYLERVLEDHVAQARAQQAKP